MNVTRGEAESKETFQNLAKESELAAGVHLMAALDDMANMPSFKSPAAAADYLIGDNSNRFLLALSKRCVSRAENEQMKTEIIKSMRGDLGGLILTNNSGLYQMFGLDPSEPGRCRSTYFDANGFSGHRTADDYSSLLSDAFIEGYREESPDALKILSACETFTEGNKVLALIADGHFSKSSLDSQNISRASTSIEAENETPSP